MSKYDDSPYVLVERQSSGVGTFLFGALLGAGIALLFAPRTGDEVRKGITTRARKLRDSAENTVRNVQQSMDDALSNVRDQMIGRVEAAREAYDSGRETARESRADMERRIREARAGFEAGVRAGRRGRPGTNDQTGTAEGEDVVI